MFFGTTPSIISQYLNQEIIKHNPKRVWVLFAGNFVVEQIVGQSLPECEVHSTDISMYSRAIGYASMNKESEIKLLPEYGEMYPICAKLKTPTEIAAQVIFFSDVAKNLNKDHIPYYNWLIKDSKDNEERYIEKILQKLERFKENTKNMIFYGTDACDFIPDVQEGDLVFYDPPVDLGNYESEFRALESCYDFAQPPYTQMTDEVKQDQLSHFTDINAVAYYRNNNPLPKEFLENLKGYTEVYRYQYKYNGHYCVYSNDAHSNFVGQWSPVKEEVKNLKLINDKDVITEDSEVKILQVKTTIANHYRLMWVKKAEMLDSGWAWLVFIDDKVVGVLQLADSVKFGSDLILINSDPCCPYSDYRRLSKLMLYICCTQEIIDIVNEKAMWEHTGFTTRVFTNAPVSMKYRSLFDLKERSEDVGGNYKNKLIYQNRNKILPTMKDGLLAWLKKDGKQTFTKLQNGH